jgi:hypothetical protein
MYSLYTHKWLNPLSRHCVCLTAEEVIIELTKNLLKVFFGEFRRSKRALAIPMTFLILFVSTLGLISVTYFFAVEKVNSQSLTIKMATAKQDLLSLDQSIMSVVWQPGSARSVEISDSGGKINIQPLAGSLTLSLSDKRDFNQIVNNQTTGQVVYELPYSGSPETGLFLKGDSRTITNQSGSLSTQLCIENGPEHPEIQLHYRPVVSYSVEGVEEGRTINNLRIYVINMNESESISLNGKIPLRVSCESTKITTETYNVSYAIDALTITSVMNGVSGQTSIPISSTSNGAVINFEIVQSNVKIERSLM